MICKIIADAGSSKTDWALTDMQGAEIKRFSTQGLNALLSNADEIEASLRCVTSQIPDGHTVKEVYYYGAGCATAEINEKMRCALAAALHADTVNVESDLLGAARSLLGHGRGIACILGTGSNSCLYDGQRIVENIPSLGYILGDEGSGAAIGKRLLSDALKGRLPKDVTANLLGKYDLTLAEVLNRVYRMPAPNKFLASLVPFVHEQLSNPYVYTMARDEFKRFLVRNVSSYSGARRLPICFTGSVAYHFREVIEEAVTDLGLKIGLIEAHPLDGLVQYHGFKI